MDKQEEINYGRGLLSSQNDNRHLQPTDTSRNLGGVGAKQLQFNLTTTSHSNVFSDVRIRKAPSKVELKSRLYDNGLSEKTMPSVQRPNAPLEGTPSIKAKMNKGEKPSGRVEIGKSQLPPPVQESTKFIPKPLLHSGAKHILPRKVHPKVLFNQTAQFAQGTLAKSGSNQMLSQGTSSVNVGLSAQTSMIQLRGLSSQGNRIPSQNLKSSNNQQNALKSFNESEVDIVKHLHHIPSAQQLEPFGGTYQIRPTTTALGDIPRMTSQLLQTTGGLTQRGSNPQFTNLNMAPYHRPQSQAFGFRHGSLQRDPSKKTLRAAEEITSITGVKTMSALGPSLHKTEFNYRRTSCSHAEELIKQRNINSRQLKRVILTSSNAPFTIREEHEEFVFRQSIITEQINNEHEERRLQNLTNSPTRVDQDGVVTIVGKQEYDDEVLRSHYMMHMIRSKDNLVPLINRGQQKVSNMTKHVNLARSASFMQNDTYKNLVDPRSLQGTLQKHISSKNVGRRNFGALPMVPSIEGLIKEEEIEVEATLSNAMANNSGIGASSRGGPERNEIESHIEEYDAESKSSFAKRASKKDDVEEMSVHNPKHPSRWRDLDKLISLLQTQQEDDGYFIYLKAGDNGDPYDLHPLIESARGSPQKQAVSKKSLQLHTSKLERYYTLSRKGITTYRYDEPVDYIQLTDWLIERNYYLEIRHKRFFHEFRRWKVLRMWRRNILYKKREEVKASLSEKLFILDGVFQPILIHHREKCKNLEQYRLVNLNSGSGPHGNQGVTLDEFKSIQDRQRDFLSQRITEANNSTRIKFRAGINSILDNLRQRINEFAQEEQVNEEDDPNNLSATISNLEGGIKERKGTGGQNAVFEQLGFKHNLKYGPRSKLRQSCSRFLRFSYLLDFVALETLANIFVESVKDTVIRLRDVTDIVPDLELKQVVKNALGEVINQGTTSGPGKKTVDYTEALPPQPLFKVHAHILTIATRALTQNGSEGIPLRSYKTISVKQFDPSQHGQKEFDPIVHIEIKEPKKGGSDDSVQNLQATQNDAPEDDQEEDRERYIERQLVENINEYWLSVEPTKTDFAAQLRYSLQDEGLVCLRKFERYSRHEELLPYVRVLESWDDRVCDGEWEPPDDYYLRCDEWLQDNYWFVNLDMIIEKYLNRAYDQVAQFFTKVEPFLQGYWENKRLLQDFDLGLNATIASENLRDPLDVIPFLLQRFNDQKINSENMIPAWRDLGLLRMNLQQVKDTLTPQAKLGYVKLRKIFPQMIRLRLDEHKRWLQKQITLVSKPPVNVDSYVKQIQVLDYLERTYQSVKDKIETNVQLFNICIHFEMESKEEKNRKFIDEVYSIMSQLSNAIIKAHDNADKRKDQMKLKIQNKIPKLNQQVNEFLDTIVQDRLLDINSPFEETLAEVEALEARCNQLGEKAKDIIEYQKTLEMDINPFQYVEDARNAMLYRAKLWRSLHEWGVVLVNKWRTAPFDQVDVLEITQKSELYTKVALQCERNLPAGSTAVAKLKQLVFDFRETMPIVEALGNPNLQKEHWLDIKTVIKVDAGFPLEERTFTLGQLINLNVALYQEEIISISITATQESNLRAQLKDINSVWNILEFKLVKHKDRSDSYKLSEVDIVQNALDESLTAVSNILGSRYVKRLQPEAEYWQVRLNMVAETLEAWKEFQRTWLYLDNILTSSDIRKNLSKDTPDFDNISRQWNKLMKLVNNRPNVMNNCVNGQKLQEFLKFNQQLDRIQKDLDNYLEQKRCLFPRFYFLSNDELLQILANAHDIKSVEKHINKFFENINGFMLVDGAANQPDISGVVSGEREEMDFQLTRIRIAKTGNGVEGWLKALEQTTQTQVFKRIKEAYASHNLEKTQRKDWVLQHIGQAIASVSQIAWTENCEVAISDMEAQPFALQDLHAGLIQQLQQLTLHIQNPSLHFIKRKILVSLMTTDVHARDIVDTLSQEGVESINDFNWQKQLRYYLDNEVLCVRQVNATINYGNEYMGASSRLVITPLTDRCWITITGAMHIKLGAAPAGPAGTGKTESTKDLAKALGIYCVVFNCSDQIEYKMMARLFSGLVQSGAWSCLDEFNRIDVEVLSVIAQQLLDIKEAKIMLNDVKDKEKQRFIFNGTEMELKQTCGIFVTMNPGYAGRTELPDNLKVLFRPVSMMIPNYGLIAEIMLFAEGFENAKPLSTKMVQLYKLASEQLSQQDHYDFGMRAVKSVLVMAGTLKRANRELSEDVVLIRAMRDSNIPKFLAQDLPLFSALIQDLFPGIKIPEVNYGELSDQINKSISTLGLQNVENYKMKIIQLFDTFNVRFGVMLVGPTGGGKSTCFKVLGHAMSVLRNERHSKDVRFQEVRFKVLNPKSITMGELYGEENSDTKEWTDGLASKIIRKFAKEEDTGVNQRLNWCVFDGPVDALWIENMNTVLDDNMTLCLANGERIKLKWSIRMLFEVQDLAVASPATVSRCGMVYITPSDLGWKPYLQSWLQLYCIKREVLSQEACIFLEDLFNQHLDEGILKAKSVKGEEQMPTVSIQIVKCICNFLEYLFTSHKQAVPILEKKEIWSKKVSFYFGFAFIWGFGSAYKPNALRFVDNMLRDFFGKLHIPMAETVFEYYFNEKEQRFVHWSRLVPSFVYEPKMPFFQIMVPTVETVRYTALLDMLIQVSKPVLFTGSTGVGKSVMIQNYLASHQEKQNFAPIQLTFSAQTNSNATQQTIEAKLEKKKGKKVIGSKGNFSCVIFVDDVNMPMVEQYGAQPPIELLRQMIDHGGFYDRPNFYWKEIQRFNIICAAAPPGGGRSALTPRFMRHFHIFNLPDPSEDSMRSIFEAILREFLNVNHFPESVRKLSGMAVAATVDMYSQITMNLLPIPAKFHYTFNLRDVAKVFQGMLMTKPQSITTADLFARLWLHECTRVFCDRLINEKDRTFFQVTAQDLLKSKLKVNWNLKDINLFSGKQMIIFAVLLKLDLDEPIYEEISDKKKLYKTLEENLADFNISCSSNKMDLVFFDDAISHICRISRILTQPRGNAMLIGVSGCGKQSLTRLSSCMLQCKSFQIKLSKNYKPINFREDIKLKMLDAGCDSVKNTFILTDTQIMYESFLEDINNILNTGEITNLYAKEDYERMFASLAKINQQMKRPETKDCIYQTFIERVRDFFHIILCMSPVGDTLRIRCRKFPSLVNCCTLDWFDNWPEEALLSVSDRFLSTVPDLAPTKAEADDLKAKLSQMFKLVHKSVENMSVNFFEEMRRQVYITPKSYLDGITLYLKFLGEQRAEAKENIMRLINGCKKLKDTNEQIADLQISLAALLPRIEEENQKAGVKALEIKDNKLIAFQKEAVVEQENSYVQAEAHKVDQLKRENDVELAKCKPALEDAERAVNELNKDNITELKTLKSPPQVVETALQCVFIYLGYPKQEWKQALGIISDIKFLDRLKSYDNKNITQKTLLAVRQMITQDNFNPTDMAARSKVAGGLAKWCKATYMYAEAWKVVKPREQKQRELTEKLEVAEQQVAVKKAELKVIQDELSKMESEFEQLMAYISKLDSDKVKFEKRLVNAQKLQVLLADEGDRWAQKVELMNKEIEKLNGNVFIAASSISYFGPFTGTYREKLVEQWQQLCIENKIPISEKYSLVSTLGDPVEIRNWNLCSLPSDAVSIDNAILATKTSRWPLMIDPQSQANTWIKKMSRENQGNHQQLKVIKLSDGPAYQKTMEAALMQGATVIIEDVSEELDPGLDSVLTRAIYKEDGLEKINFGDRAIIYDRNFRLFITTKISNPHFLPEICIKLTVINFTVTFDGLEEQMLVDVVINEAPEVEKKRDDLVLQIASFKNVMKSLENKILKDLAESNSETILDNDALIQTLEEAKDKSRMIAQSLVESEEVEVTINETRFAYKEVSARGSILYFVISDLALIDPMYQNSLAYIKKLFNDAIINSKPAEKQDERIQILMDSITESLYVNICRGLFEAHKLLYSFMMCTSILRRAAKINEKSWNYLLRGAGIYNKADQPLRPQAVQSFMSEGAWDLAYCIQQSIPQSFTGFCKLIADHPKTWERYSMRDDEDYIDGMPCGIGMDQGIPLFDKLLVLKIFKPEKLLFAFQRYVENQLGKQYAESPIATMDALFSNSDSKTPIIFVLSQGADPTQQVLTFAKKMNFQDKLFYKSLGQGQERVATEMIEKGKREGSWVLLQNCHLFKSWMPALEVICEKNTEDVSKTHPDFRLIMTSMPADYFPASILQNGLKMTTEPPRGVKANLKRSYTNLITTESYKCVESPNKQEQDNQGAFNKLLFGLSFFHSVVQERRKFGPLGWNIRYEFNDSDLDTSIQMLKNFLLEAEVIPWDALRYMTGDINYGGRVTDDWDRILLLHILRRYYNEALIPEEDDDDANGQPISKAIINYKLSESGIYRIFTHSNIEEIQNYIDTLPPTEDPEVFGLHPNANIAFQLQESEKIIRCILNVQPRVSTSAAENKGGDTQISDLVSQLEASIPPILDKEEHAKDIFKLNNKGLMHCLATVLLQEIERYNRLLQKMTESLRLLGKAIKGLVIMSPELDLMCSTMLKNQVPPNWSAISYPSLKTLASWIKDLNERLEFMRGWLKHGHPPCYWLSGFFFPHGFMTGTLQTYARNYLKPIDQLTFKYKLLPSYDHNIYIKPPKDGIYVYGLFIEGARWNMNKRHLDEQLPGEMTSSMPVIHFLPKVIQDKSKPQLNQKKKKAIRQLGSSDNPSSSDSDEDDDEDEQTKQQYSFKYKCPVYKTSVRAGTLSTTGQSTNYILAIDLTMAQMGVQEHWALRGTALISMLND